MPEKELHFCSAPYFIKGHWVIGQVAVNEKANEILTLKDFLEPMNLEGTGVTANALHTQKDTARFLVEGKGADYLFIVKNNQSALRRNIEDLHMEAFPPSTFNNGKEPWPT